MPNLLWFEEVGIGDVAMVGGKNASLGEMSRELAGAGIRVPQGFATTADAFRTFIADNDLRPRIVAALRSLGDGAHAVGAVGREVREAILASPLPDRLRADLVEAYRTLGA
ncbi:MAG: PEP/pyruvate-binding domain-containing protein, partial [Allosphingosinicella sp.]